MAGPKLCDSISVRRVGRGALLPRLALLCIAILPLLGCGDRLTGEGLRITFVSADYYEGHLRVVLNLHDSGSRLNVDYYQGRLTCVSGTIHSPSEVSLRVTGNDDRSVNIKAIVLTFDSLSPPPPSGAACDEFNIEIPPLEGVLKGLAAEPS